MRVKGTTIQQIVLGLALLAALCWNLAQANEIKGLQLSDSATGTRAELQLQTGVAFRTMTLSGPDRFVIDRNRVTISGAAPAADFMLHLIRARHGAALARQVAASFLTRARPGHEPQIAALEADPALDPRVAAALARMEARIDTPETVAVTATAVGLSPRRLETLFRDALGTTPAAHAQGLRLQAARRMLTDTKHPLAEVALRTGFSGPATLSRAFSARFGHPPGRLRRGLTDT